MKSNNANSSNIDTGEFMLPNDALGTKKARHEKNHLVPSLIFIGLKLTL